VGARHGLPRVFAAATVRQYEIWWASLPPPVGRRPVLLLSRDSAYAVLNKVIVAEVTSTLRDIPVEVRLGHREGLARRSVANLDNVHVVARADLVSRIGALARSRESEVKRALGYALDWPELKFGDDAAPDGG
jgi:mRNA interferase MazF